MEHSVNKAQSLTHAQLVGADPRAIVDFCGQRLHRDVVAPLQQLIAAAALDGFDLAVASGYRSFERQLQIWNDKAQGVRPVFDAAGELLDIEALDERQRVYAILRWSALPGGSRHHWGCDLDIFDRAAVAADYRVQLIDEEVYGQGVFARMHNWLDQRITSHSACGFYRPYTGDTGACLIAAERWHLSYQPLAAHFQRALSRELVYQHLAAETRLQLRDVVLAEFDRIFECYIALPCTIESANSGSEYR